MAAHIPSDMLPRLDWNAEDKLTAWIFFRERLEQYFMIASTPEEAKVTHILFYGSKETSERWTALKDQVDQTKLKDVDTVLKPTALRRAPVTGRPGMSTLQTSPDYGLAGHIHQGPDKEVSIPPGRTRVI